MGAQHNKHLEIIDPQKHQIKNSIIPKLHPNLSFKQKLLASHLKDYYKPMEESTHQQSNENITGQNEIISGMPFVQYNRIQLVQKKKKDVKVVNSKCE